VIPLQLKRDLGLYALFTISLGAMVGSGIYVLPGLAFSVAGPAVILAYFLAGVVVLPAALSQSEMATAMPQAGGAYLYIDRAMGPLVGTIAGFGVWFSLVFKSGFALVGLGEYLQLVFTNAPAKPIALGLAVVLIALNSVGVKVAGRFQSVAVTVVMAALVLFVLVGLGSGAVEADNFTPFAPEGLRGLLAATGLVFISYAGVTNLASVAGEVKRPTRTIPRAMLISVGIMMLLYPAIVFVIVGVTPAAALYKDATPVSTAAGVFLGDFGILIIGVTAVIALTSMANAGVLASSRYPFAMARNGLAPAPLGKIGSGGTPIGSVLLTGAVLLGLIAIFPLVELAKLASAFQLLVFSFINLAVIAFRESKVDWYRPPFKSPLYPWVQIFGIVAALLLLSQMGVVPITGAVVIILGGALWYRVFGRSRSSHESASLDALRLRATERLVIDTKRAVKTSGNPRTVVPVPSAINDRRLHDLLRTAATVGAAGGSIDLIRVDREGPDTGVHASSSEGGEAFDRRVVQILDEQGVEAKILHATGRHRRVALAEHIGTTGSELVLTELDDHRHVRGFGSDMEWLGDRVRCNFVFLGHRYLDEIDDIAILGSGGPLDPVKVMLAHQIAGEEGASIRFVHVLEEDASGRQVADRRAYHERLGDLLSVPTVSRVQRSSDLLAALTAESRTADLVIVGALRTRFRVLTDLVDRLKDEVDAPVLLVRTHELSSQRSVAVRLVERLVR
jgi:amino acid transporter